jgi:lysophospholipase L1-like esterase
MAIGRGAAKRRIVCYARGSITGLLVFVVITNGLSIASTAARDSSYKPLLVGMGDSFTSGYGLPPYEPNSIDNECYRSQQSYPVLAAEMLGFDVKNVSCSGALPADFTTARYGVETAQADSIADADFIAFTIGGMSVGGPRGILEAAANADANADFHRELEQLKPVLRATSEAVHRAAPEATIFALGYPDIVPVGRLTLARCVGLQAVGIDVDVLHQNVAALNDTIADAAASAGVIFVPTTPSFADHDICSREPYAFSPHAAAARGVEPDGVLHPNAAGQRQLADDLVAAIRAADSAPATPTAARPVPSSSPEVLVEQPMRTINRRTKSASFGVSADPARYGALSASAASNSSRSSTGPGIR